MRHGATPLLCNAQGSTNQERLNLRQLAGQDIGVVGAELDQNPAFLYLTHTAQRIDEMGRSAVKLLLDPPQEKLQKHVLIPPRLVAGRPLEPKTSEPR